MDAELWAIAGPNIHECLPQGTRYAYIGPVLYAWLRPDSAMIRLGPNADHAGQAGEFRQVGQLLFARVDPESKNLDKIAWIEKRQPEIPPRDFEVF